jgi:hypothetical protein
LAATEPQRLALHAAARAALGPEEGDTLMALTPPANTDIATMQGVALAIAGLRGDLTARIEHGNGRTLRWTVGTMLAGNAGTVALLALILH